jgi:hypothetical protein
MVRSQEDFQVRAQRFEPRQDHIDHVFLPHTADPLRAGRKPRRVVESETPTLVGKAWLGWQ